MWHYLALAVLCSLGCTASATASTVGIDVAGGLSNRATDWHLQAQESSFHDPVHEFRIIAPANGDLVSAPFTVRCIIGVDDTVQFQSLYANRSFCVELNGVVTKCLPLMRSQMEFDSLAIDDYSATAFITDQPEPELGYRRRFHPTGVVTFSIVDHETLAKSGKDQDRALRQQYRIAPDPDLLLWSQRIDTTAVSGSKYAEVSESDLPHSNRAPLLVIGVKSDVLNNFAYRQAIRETWASKQSLRDDTRVIFIGCRPHYDETHDAVERQRLEKAVALEKQVYGDLLTDELDCDDLYHELDTGVKEFIHWTVNAYNSASYVMIADDDVYLRVEKLKQLLVAQGDPVQLYAGQVWSKKFNRELRPTRDALHQNYLSEEVYSMDTLPPFAFGPHYILSMDCAKFISKNRHKLRGLGGMDDISVALWLLAIQVHPRHLPGLWHVHGAPCDSELIAVADLVPLSIRVIHSNLQAGFPFCDGFHSTAWFKETPRVRSVVNVRDPSLDFVSVDPRSDETTQSKPQHDPINLFELVFPHDGELVLSPVHFVTNIQVDDFAQFETMSQNLSICAELNGSVMKCACLKEPSWSAYNLQPGNYVARAFIGDNEIGTAGTERKRYYQTAAISFTVITDEAMASYWDSEASRLRREYHLPGDLHLLSWAYERLQGHIPFPARSMTSHHQGETDSSVLHPDPLLVIGVKTVVRTNFHLRQAIRETWASASSLPSDVRVVFIGCRSNFDDLRSPDLKTEWTRGITLEKQAFGDLLTDELDCNDNYSDLHSKVKEFIHWTVEMFSGATYVMLVDDDVHLQVDELKQKLSRRGQTERLYLGQVWDRQYYRPSRPIRDTTQRYFLSETVYPMHYLPPFGFGPHYVMSMDCAKFIAKNRQRLHGLNGMDDISVALWLLAIQVHPQHTDKFLHLRSGQCLEHLISFADLSPLGIRMVHSNLLAGRAYCHGFHSLAWRKDDTSHELRRRSSKLVLMSSVRDIRTTITIEIAMTVNGLEFTYTPSAETFAHFSRRVCAHARQLLLRSIIDCSSMEIRLREHLEELYIKVEASGMLDRSRLELWRHNLFVANANAPPAVIGFHNQASCHRIILECLFAAMYTDNPVVVVGKEIVARHYRNESDVYVFSILDAGCSHRHCRMSVANNRDHPARIMVFSGESWNIDGLDDSVTLVSTVSHTSQLKRVYISMASASFAERLDHSPLDLLSPSHIGDMHHRGFCAFLYSQCEWPHRQYFFDMLNELEPVDALGACAGASTRKDFRKLASRQSNWYLDDAVKQFQRYRFVVAFENSIAPGYVTEKIVNAFLAGAIPIYWGNSTSVATLFNPRSFIDCGSFRMLRECADFVVEVHQSPTLYASMRQEPPILDMVVFNEFFSWHPLVDSSDTARVLWRHLYGNEA